MGTVLLGTHSTHCSAISVFVGKRVLYSVDIVYLIIAHTSLFALVFKKLKNEHTWIKFIKRKAHKVESRRLSNVEFPISSPVGSGQHYSLALLCDDKDRALSITGAHPRLSV